MSTDSFLTSLFGLKGRVAVVTGGTGELCGAIAEGLASAGAEVVLVGRNADKARARLEKISAGGGTHGFTRLRRQARRSSKGCSAPC